MVDLHIDSFTFEPSPMEITRHNWCLARYVSGNRVSLLHFCDDNSYVDGLLIDDLWWENASGCCYNEIEDIYVLKSGISNRNDYILSSGQSFLCKAKKIKKRFIRFDEIDLQSQDTIRKYGKTLITRYKTSQMTPLLSIVTTIFNNAVLLEQTIQSVINQKSERIEYIIKDAGSTDNFDEVVGKYSEYAIRVIKCKDRGIYDGMDQGFKEAKGEYIQILNSDDALYCFDVAEHYIKEIEKKDADAFCSDIVLCFPDGKRTVRKADLKKLQFQSCINHTSLVMKYDDYRKVGGFDTNLKIAADCDLTIKMVKAGLKIKHIPIICVNFRMGGVSSDISWRQLIEGLICRYRYSALNISGYVLTIAKFLKMKFL